VTAIVSAPKYPTPPDPATTAAAQTGSNIQTAEANQTLNSTNQVTPYGTLTYSKTGGDFISDPKGQTWYMSPTGDYTQTAPTDMSGYQKLSGYYVPQYTATTTLSPDQQKLLDQQNEFGQLSNQIGIDQTKKIGDLLSSPLDLNDATAQNQILSAYQPMLDQQWGKQQADLESTLANKGIKQGSAAYTNAMNDFQNQKAQAYNQMYLTARQQGVNEAMAQRQEPINEITALLSGGQVTNPAFGSTPTGTVNGTDVAGIIENNYNQQVAQANAKAAANNSMMGGIFGLLSAPLMGWAMGSDRRMKEDVHKVGEVGTGDDKMNVYSFKYKEKYGGGGLQHLGLMAQEVEKKIPEAVTKRPDGMKAVYYGKVADTLAGAH
jgi:hypothetical protein